MRAALATWIRGSTSLLAVLSGMMFVASIGACDDSSGIPALGKQDCDREVLALRGWLSELTRESVQTLVPLDSTLRLLVANVDKATPPNATGPLVEVWPDRIQVCKTLLKLRELNNRQLDQRLDELLGEVVKQAEHLMKLSNGEMLPRPLLVAMDRDASWEHLVRVHDAAARSGFRKLALLFRPAGGVEQIRPGASPIDDQLDAVRAISDPLEKVPRMAELARGVTRSCSPLDEVFRTLSVTNPEARNRVLVSRLPRAVTACRCSVDLRSLKAVLWTLFERSSLVALRFDIASGERDKEQVVAEENNKPWHEACLGVFSLARPGFSPRVRFESKP